MVNIIDNNGHQNHQKCYYSDVWALRDWIDRQNSGTVYLWLSFD